MNNSTSVADVNNQTEQKLNDAELKAIENKNKTWMDFEDFFVCFK
jgi:hypothetical protein